MILEVQNGCFGYPKQPVILENIRFVSISRRNFFKFSIFVSSDKKKAGHL